MIGYEFNCNQDMAEWLISRGECHTNKVNNVKKAIFTRIKNGKDYYDYTFYRETLEIIVETIEKIT